MKLQSGERICVRTVDDEGIPIVRYGTVATNYRTPGPVVVLFDDLEGSDLVDPSEVHHVDYDTVELQLRGLDLLHEEHFRSGLATMWRAEADLAGLDIAAIFPMGPHGTGTQDSDGSWMLAEFTIHGITHIVRATQPTNETTTVIVRADRMNRWDGFFHP